LVAEEDRAARSLVKGEVQDEVEIEPPNGDVEAASIRGNDNESNTNNKADKSDVASSEEGESNPKSTEHSEYLENKRRNVAELQKKLEEVKAQFPMPEGPVLGGLQPKQATERPVSKRKAHSDEPVIRRESQRNKDKRFVP